MKTIVRKLYMHFYRRELLEIARNVRSKKESPDLMECGRLVGVLDTLGTLDLLE